MDIKLAGCETGIVIGFYVGTHGFDKIDTGVMFDCKWTY